MEKEQIKDELLKALCNRQDECNYRKHDVVCSQCLGERLDLDKLAEAVQEIANNEVKMAYVFQYVFCFSITADGIVQTYMSLTVYNKKEQEDFFENENIKDVCVCKATSVNYWVTINARLKNDFVACTKAREELEIFINKEKNNE